jgi:hypothetical protein
MRNIGPFSVLRTTLSSGLFCTAAVLIAQVGHASGICPERHLHGGCVTPSDTRANRTSLIFTSRPKPSAIECFPEVTRVQEQHVMEAVWRIKDLMAKPENREQRLFKIVGGTVRFGLPGQVRADLSQESGAMHSHSE